MADQKIVVDADMRGFLTAMGKVKQAGYEAAKTVAGGAKGIEEGFGRATIKIDAIKRALMAAGAAVNAQMSQMETASKAQREGRLRIAEIGAGAGLGGGQIAKLQRDIESAPGPTTPEERMQFLENVTKAAGRRKPEFNDLRNALLAYSAGGDVAFGKGGADVVERMKKGRPLTASMAQVWERRAPGAISTLSTPEAAEKATLEMYSRATQKEAAKYGGTVEMQKARLEYIKAESPTVGGMAEALDSLTGGLSSRMLEVQSGIRDDSRENVRLLTEIMGMQRRPMRPQIGAQGERAK